MRASAKAAAACLSASLTDPVTWRRLRGAFAFFFARTESSNSAPSSPAQRTFLRGTRTLGHFSVAYWLACVRSGKMVDTLLSAARSMRSSLWSREKLERLAPEPRERWVGALDMDDQEKEKNAGVVGYIVVRRE